MRSIWHPYARNQALASAQRPFVSRARSPVLRVAAHRQVMTTTQIRHRTLPDFLHLPNQFDVHAADEVMVALSCSTARVKLVDLCNAIADFVGFVVESPRNFTLGSPCQRPNPALTFAGPWAWSIDGGLTVSVQPPALEEQRGDAMTYDLSFDRPWQVTLTIGEESATVDVGDFLGHLSQMNRLGTVEFWGGSYTRYATPVVRAS